MRVEVSCRPLPRSRSTPGRTGKKAGTRELLLTPLPWIVVYTVRADATNNVRICTVRSGGHERARYDDGRRGDSGAGTAATCCGVRLALYLSRTNAT